MKNSVPKTTNRELRLIILEEKDYAIEMLVLQQARWRGESIPSESLRVVLEDQHMCWQNPADLTENRKVKLT